MISTTDLWIKTKAYVYGYSLCARKGKCYFKITLSICARVKSR